ncbi:MAG: hypothetical protein HY909_02140 [Deltaproteobacteria bacterium]|nr:hypothetical protein [Deltaproteobacteria bacterium]
MSFSRRWQGLALAGFLVGLGALRATSVEGVVTRTMVLDSAQDLSAGVLDRVAVTSDGVVVLGAELARVAPPDGVSSVWALLDLGDGSALAGTGPDGRVYRVQNGRATLYAQTDALVVTSFTRADDGTVYAGTLPDGKLLRLVPPSNGRVQPPVVVATLPGAQHVWSVLLDAQRRAVLCATGPEGKLFAVDPRGAATVVFDSEEPHLYAMAPGPNREVLVGSGGGHALLYGVRGPGQARVLARLAGDEVKGIAVFGDAIAVASNEFPEPPEAPRRTASQGRAPSPGGSSAGRARPGRGNLYLVRASGLAERVWTSAETHVTALELDAAHREVLLALGANGRVVAVAEDRTARVAFDVDEPQVQALAITSRARLFATGDPGAFYAVGQGAPQDATWHSRVLDGAAPSRWGAVRWRGQGQLDWFARTGNSDTPDATWSAWQALDPDGVVASPAARYLQVRARFGRAADTALRSVTVYYLPENQRAVVTEVTGTPPETKAGETRPSVLRLAWKVENPDNDTLRYRLRFRGETDVAWRPLVRNQEWVTGTSYEWPTDGLPEGFYRVEVEASDEASNPDDGTTRDRRSTEAVLVDNTPPVVTVTVAGARVTGRAVDQVSGVLRVELSVDGGEWRAARATDGVLDERSEDFEAPMPRSGAAQGDHVVSVRAYDEAGNLGVGSARFRGR